MKTFLTYNLKVFYTLVFLAIGSLSFAQTLEPVADYPLSTDLNDALGYAGPIFNIGGTFANNQICLPGDYFDRVSTSNFNQLDPNGVEFSLDFNLDAYSTHPNREGTLLMLGGSYRPLGIIVSRTGEIGFKYNNGINVLSTSTVNLNQWYNARLRYLNGVITLYLDNVLVHTLNVGSINYHPSYPNVDAYLLTTDQSGGTVALEMCVRNVKIATDWEPPVVEPGAALRSSGGSQLVRVADDPSLDLECEMTLEAWVNLSSPYIWGAILLKASGNSWSNGYGIYARYNQIVFMPRGFGQQHFSGYNLPLNTWTHVACTYDGATSKIYINGNLVSTQAISGDIPQNNFPLGVGGDAGFTPFSFRGAIDEVRVWSQVLEQSDIQAGMNCEIQTTSDCLVANYHFNQGTAGANNAGETTLIDASAYGNNGTLQGYALSGTSSNWVAPGGVTSGVACNTSFYCDPNFSCCEGPEAICQSNTVYIQPNGYAVVTPADVDGGSTAECGLQSMTVSPNTFDCDHIGWQYVVLTVTDINGEYDQCGAWVYIDKGDALPGNMSNANIGGATGSAGYDPCEEELCIESNGITFPNADKIHMAYEYLCSNSSMVVEARILSVGPNHGLGGIMIRESLSAGAKKVALKTQLSGYFLQRDTRTTTNGFAQTQQIFRPGVNWLKIMRNGNQFIMYTRTDNTNWQFAAFAIVNMSSCVYIGLFTEGVNDNVSTTACFDNVSISSGYSGGGLVESNQGLETEEVRFGQDFEAFPNPASTVVNFRMEEMDTDAQLTIQDQLGRTIWTEEIEAGQVSTTIDVTDSKYQNGIYYLTLRSNGTTSTQKIVITK